MLFFKFLERLISLKRDGLFSLAFSSKAGLLTVFGNRWVVF